MIAFISAHCTENDAITNQQEPETSKHCFGNWWI